MANMITDIHPSTVIKKKKIESITIFLLAIYSNGVVNYEVRLYNFSTEFERWCYDDSLEALHIYTFVSSLSDKILSAMLYERK